MEVRASHSYSLEKIEIEGYLAWFLLFCLSYDSPKSGERGRMEPLSLLLTSTYHGRYLTHVFTSCIRIARKYISHPPSCIPLFPHTQDCSSWGHCTLFFALRCPTWMFCLRLVLRLRKKKIEVVHAYCINGSIRSTGISIQNKIQRKTLTWIDWRCTFIPPLSIL